MVLFGESLTTLMQPGWEAHYIDYGGLKTIIAAIKQATKAQEQSVRSTQVTASKGPLLISASLPYKPLPLIHVTAVGAASDRTRSRRS